MTVIHYFINDVIFKSKLKFQKKPKHKSGSNNIGNPYKMLKLYSFKIFIKKFVKNSESWYFSKQKFEHCSLFFVFYDIILIISSVYLDKN